MTYNLTEQLKKFKEEVMGKIPVEIQEKMREAINELVENKNIKGLQNGDFAPDFTLNSAKNEKVNLYNILKRGHVVLTFYRGVWCPYCNLELKAYQNYLKDIHNLDAELIAISPQKPDLSLTTQQKNNLEFQVLSDENNIVSNLYNLKFKLPDYLIQIQKQFNYDITKYNGNEDWELPIPATFVINSDRKIVFSYVNKDYTMRVDPIEILDVLEKNK